MHPLAILRSVSVFAASLALYTRTVAPTIYNLDSAELTTAAATGGIVRATGYPLYLLLGGAWSRLPVGDVGFRMNLMSAVAAALTLMLADRVLQRLDIGWFPAAAGLGLLAASPAFWTMANIAEVYTLQTALFAGLLLCLVYWAEAPEQPLRIGLVGLMVGLGLSHHASTGLMLPAIGVFVVWVAWDARSGGRQDVDLPWGRLIVCGTIGLGLGLTPWMIIPLRYSADPAFNYVGTYDPYGVFQPLPLDRPANLLWLATGRTFADQMWVLDGRTLPAMGAIGIGLIRALWGVGAVAAVVGGWVLMRTHRSLAVLLGGIAVVHGIFYAGYRVVDVETMQLPIHLVAALLTAVGFQWLIDWTGQDDRRPEVGPWIIRGLIAATVAVAVVWNFRIVDLSEDRSTRARGEAILSAAPRDALILGWWDTIPVVEYLTLVEGRRPDVRPINRFLIAREDLVSMVERELGRRPILIDSLPPSLDEDVRVREAGPLMELLPSPSR